MVTIRRFALALCALLALLAAAPPAGAQGAGAAPVVDPKDAVLEITVEAAADTPFVREMVLLRIRGFYDVTIALEELEQPDLANFGWTQLGRDTWASAMRDGRKVVTYERRLALYPQEDGVLRIDPFVHKLTLVATDGTRFVHEVTSNALELAVAPKPPEVEGWWLPARSVTLTDIWEGDPANLASGETATRTVEMTVLGVPPQSLPPAPSMRGHNVISFFQPEQRSTQLTPEGPLSSLRWQWKVRPVSAQTGFLPVLTMRWFDTAEREMREVVLPSQTVAFADIPDPTAVPVTAFLIRHALPLGALAGLTLGIGLVAPGLRVRNRAEIGAAFRRILPDPDRLALRRAVWRNDAPGARMAARRLLGNHSVGKAEKHDAEAALAALDRHLYGKDEVAGYSGFDLKAYAGMVLRATNTRGKPPAQ